MAGLLALFAEATQLLSAQPPLRRSFLGWTGFGLAFTVAASTGVGLLHDRSSLPPILVGAVAWWLFVCLFVLGGAPLLVDPHGRHVGRYGVPNGLTALRAWFCLPLLLDASLRLPGEVALILWCSTGFAAGMLDYVDGLIARRVGPITELGRAMDPAMDSLFFSMAAVGNLELGIVPLWLTVVMLVRYLGPFLLTPLVLLSGRRPELVHTSWGRRNTALIGLTLFVCMWTRILHGPVDVVALGLALPLVVPTGVLHFLDLARRTAAAPRVGAPGVAGPDAGS